MSCSYQERPRPPQGSRLVLLFSDSLSNIYSVFEYERTYMLIYDPTTPFRSCSGKYSGGSPFIKELSENEYFELKKQFENLAKKKENHTFDRSRPAGLFTSSSEKFIVRKGFYDEFEQNIKKHNKENNEQIFRLQETVDLME